LTGGNLGIVGTYMLAPISHKLLLTAVLRPREAYSRWQPRVTQYEAFDKSRRISFPHPERTICLVTGSRWESQCGILRWMNDPRVCHHREIEYKGLAFREDQPSSSDHLYALGWRGC
jgi:hypothetical protein